MITYRLGLFQREPERARELVEAINRHPGSCDTVWLTSIGYYPSIEKHREYAESWVEAADILRKGGLRVSMQIANTIGHCDWAQLNPEKKDTYVLGMLPDGEDPYLVGPEGIKNMSCFCWRSKQFKKHIHDVVQTYVSILKPYRLWFDDDLRPLNHKPNKFACYCDRCIAKFNEENGTSYTREELVEKMNYSDMDLREKYINFIRQGVYEFVYEASKAALEVAPDTLFGHEYEHEHNYLGANDEHILGAYHDASGKEVETRPGGRYYNDKAPWDQYKKFFSLNMANSILPPYVTACIAEIENLPGVVFGKSIGGILNESTMDLAMGACTGLSYTDVQSVHEPMAYYEKIFAAIATARPYWEKLSDLSRNAHRGGLNIFTGEKQHLRIYPREKGLVAWDWIIGESDINLTRIGVPLTYEKKGPAAYLLHHDIVDGLTNEEIEFLLTQPVLVDGESVVKIMERGYANHFALTPKEAHYLTIEYFTGSPLNGEKCGLFYDENPYAASPMRRYSYHDLDGRTEVLGTIHNNEILSDGSCLGACTIVTELTQSKAKWAIFGYSLWSDLVSSAKRNEILSALDAICIMPARILAEEQASLTPCVDGNGRTLAVTIASTSQNGTAEMEVAVRKPFGTRIRVMDAYGNDIMLDYKEISEDEIIVKLPALIPYGVATIFLER